MLNGKLDFRSDTITEPTEEMREAMARAKVGDDGREGDPTVRELEEYSAQLLGKEAALFVISGTMGNLVSILAHTRHGQEVILERDAHIFWTEVAGISAVGGLLVNRVAGTDGIMAPGDVEAAIRIAKLHFPETGLICLENTHNMAGGTVWSVAQMAAVKAVAERHGIPVHLDGARIFNAAVALGVTVRDLSDGAATVMISLSKGLSAPAGSILVGGAETCRVARRIRKMLGGGMRQAGILAAAGIVALDTMINRLAEDHAIAYDLACGLASIRGIEINVSKVVTNIVLFRVPGKNTTEVLRSLKEKGILAGSIATGIIRMVTHKDIRHNDIFIVIDAVSKVLPEVS